MITKQIEENIRIKTFEEIEGIRKSCKLSARTLEYLKPHIVPGISTGEIDRLAEKFIRDHGAVPAPLNYRGYPKSVCTSLNEIVCHGVPSDSVILKEGDILNVDVSTVLDGYYGDTCTMYTVGKISESASNLLKVAKKCLDLGIKEVRPGNFLGNIGMVITRHALLNGCSVVFEFCGHGVGIEFHEPPQVSHFVTRKNQGLVMKSGMVFTIEPMINEGVPHTEVMADNWTARTLDNRLSAQYEHTVLVTDHGHEILTVP